MAKSVTILGPYSPKYFVDNTSTIETAISGCAGVNDTLVSADPLQVLGNFYIIVTTS